VAIQPADPGGTSPALPGSGYTPGDHRRPWLIMAALLLGLAGLTASVAGVVVQMLPRRFSVVQAEQLSTWEMLRRWRAWPAGQIFPRTLGYELPGYAFRGVRGLHLTAHRVGIARMAHCASAVDAAAAKILTGQGCQVVLRATYVDATRSLVTTVGVAVMPTPAAASSAATALSAGSGVRPGIVPVPFPRTIAARFGEQERQLTVATSDGPYLVLSAAGFADGRPRVRISTDGYTDAEMFSLANGLAGAVQKPLAAAPPAPRCPGAPGC
jgi:hypothetical protein